MEHQSNLNISTQPRIVFTRRKLSEEEKRNMTALEIRTWKAREMLRRKVTKSWARRAQHVAVARELKIQKEAVNKDGPTKEQRVDVLITELEIQGDKDVDVDFDIDMDNITE